MPIAAAGHSPQDYVITPGKDTGARLLRPARDTRL